MVLFVFAQFQIVGYWLANCIFINILITGNKRPTPKELLDIYQYANHWEVIGIQLGVNIKIIRKDHGGDCMACFRVALQKWLDATPRATWKMLEDAIYKTVKLDG